MLLAHFVPASPSASPGRTIFPGPVMGPGGRTQLALWISHSFLGLPLSPGFCLLLIAADLTHSTSQMLGPMVIDM